MKVKGTLIIDYVRIIRANRERSWDRWLAKEDWEIIDGQVLPSNWYPYESFRRIGFAVFKEIANSDLNVAQQFGRLTIRNLAKGEHAPAPHGIQFTGSAPSRKSQKRRQSSRPMMWSACGWVKITASSQRIFSRRHCTRNSGVVSTTSLILSVTT